MPVRLPATIEIDDEALEELRRAMEEKRPPEVPPFKDGVVELPPSWRPVKTEHGVTYTWGEDRDVYDPFTTYQADLSTGKVRYAIGRCERSRVFGEDRVYFIVIAIGPQGGLRAIAEFLGTDNYDETGDVIAIIKGKDGTGRQFDSIDELPAVYHPWPVETYRDRVDYPGSYTKLALVCSEDDYETMLNHALAQVQLRNLDA